MVRILLTGFGAFPGAPVNPTQAIVHNLAGRWNRRVALAGIDLRTAILPVVYADVETRIRQLLAEHRPDIVVHMGLAARRRMVSIETRARNRLSIIHPDARRQFAGRMRVDYSAVPGRRSRWPVARLASAVSRDGFATRPSIDAGDFLCNQALYISLGLHAGLCGFIHVPRVRRKTRLEFPEAITGRLALPAKRPLPTMQELERAVLTALRLLATEQRHAR